MSPIELFLFGVFSLSPNHNPPYSPPGLPTLAGKDILDTSVRPPKRTRKVRNHHDRWPRPKSD